MSGILTGLKAHLWQRISAFYLLVYFPLAAWYLSQQSFATLVEFKQAVFAVEFWVMTLLALLLLLVHAWVGMRDVLMDYLPRKAVLSGLSVLGLGLMVILLNLLYLTLYLMKN